MSCMNIWLKFRDDTFICFMSKPVINDEILMNAGKYLGTSKMWNGQEPIQPDTISVLNFTREITSNQNINSY